MQNKHFKALVECQARGDSDGAWFLYLPYPGIVIQNHAESVFNDDSLMHVYVKTGNPITNFIRKHHNYFKFILNSAI